ncbi:MAG TPA: RDD family protein [Syntrophomonas sp.]|nr:RDD family protein [Syntrophomonas sp.]
MNEEQNISDNNSAPGTPYQENDQYYRVAGFWIRALAFMIDLGVIACLNGIVFHALFSDHAQLSPIYKIININSLFLGITGAIYFVLMTYYFQQTLGKMITGIKVIQAGNTPLDWTTVVFRELVGRSVSQMLGLYLGYIFCWFNRDKQCLHDMLSDTWVVHIKPQTDYKSESLRYSARPA